MVKLIDRDGLTLPPDRQPHQIKNWEVKMFRRMNPGLKGTSDDVVREEMSRTEFGLNQAESLDEELMVVTRRKGTNN